MWQNYKQRVSGKKQKMHSPKKIDYKTYQYTTREWVISVLEGMLLVAVLGYFFYQSIFWSCLLSPLILWFLKYKKEELGRKRRLRLEQQFKDTLSSLNGSIQAGYSVENAFLEAYREMTAFHGTDSIISKELAGICAGIKNSQPVEVLVQELGERSGVEDILDFGNVLVIGKKSGGNLNEIIQTSITVIREKMETKQEIETMISAKKLEANIMSVIPFFIIAYLQLTSAGYFDALYHSLGGNMIMSVCLGIYIAAVRISQKIINIEV